MSCSPSLCCLSAHSFYSFVSTTRDALSPCYRRQRPVAHGYVLWHIVLTALLIPAVIRLSTSFSTNRLSAALQVLSMRSASTTPIFRGSFAPAGRGCSSGSGRAAARLSPLRQLRVAGSGHPSDYGSISRGAGAVLAAAGITGKERQRRPVLRLCRADCGPRALAERQSRAVAASTSRPGRCRAVPDRSPPVSAFLF